MNLKEERYYIPWW